MKTKWLVIALVVSVVLNVGLLGFGIGYGAGSPVRARGIDPTEGLGRLLRSLPEERRAELARAGAPVLSNDELRRRLGATLRDLRASQQVIASVVADEPFDRDRAAAALARFRAHFAANQTSYHQAFVEILDRLTPEERQQFLEEMRSAKDRRGRHAPRPRRNGGP